MSFAWLRSLSSQAPPVAAAAAAFGTSSSRSRNSNERSSCSTRAAEGRPFRYPCGPSPVPARSGGSNSSRNSRNTFLWRSRVQHGQYAFCCNAAPHFAEAASPWRRSRPRRRQHTVPTHAAVAACPAATAAAPEKCTALLIAGLAYAVC